jgi:hypothetical protein
MTLQTSSKAPADTEVRCYLQAGRGLTPEKQQPPMMADKSYAFFGFGGTQIDETMSARKDALTVAFSQDFPRV